MAEKFDDVISEYIDFVNRQVGVYMDAMAGFAHNKVKIERQVHRVSRAIGARLNEWGQPVVVWSSYEDPSQPDIIHNRIVRADEYLAANSPGGSNEQQHVRAVLIFLVTYWECSIRPRLANAKGVARNDIKSGAMGDLTIVRNAILHANGVIRISEHKRINLLSRIFPPEKVVFVSYDDMHRVFYTIKQDVARLMFDWLGIQDAPFDPSELRGIAIQRVQK
jgi:hypothetical protein